MKKGIFKKVSALFLALTMIVTMVPTAYANTDENISVNEDVDETVETEATAEAEVTDETEKVTAEAEVTDETDESEAAEIIAEDVEAEATDVTATTECSTAEDEIAVAGVDITAPVVESVTFVENGQKVLKGTDVHIQFVGYDADQTPFSVEQTYIYVDIGGGYYSLSAKSITKLEEENTYEATFTIPNSSSEVGTRGIITFILADEAGNVREFSLTDESGNLIYTFEVCEETATGATVSNLKLSKDKVVLDDLVLKDTIVLTMDTTGITDWYNLSIRYRHEDGNSERSAVVYYDHVTETYSFELDVDHGDRAGAYELYKIYYQDKLVECNETIAFVLEKNNTDVTGPVIESMELYQNGTKLEAGAMLTQNDMVQVRIKVSDASEITNVYGILESELNNNYKDFDAAYDAELGCYIADISLETMAATEWSLGNVHAYDKYHNYSSLYNGSEGNAGNYFYVKDAEGNCQIPTYTYDVSIGGYDSYQVTTGRVTSVKEMFPNGIPDSAQKEGCEIIGWKYEYDGEIISENDTFAVSGYWMSLYPVYNKIEVSIYLEYFDSTGLRASWQDVYVDRDVTFGELPSHIAKQVNLPHNSEYTFVGWNYMETDKFVMDEVIPEAYYNTIYLAADYKENPISVSYDYVDEDGVYHNYPKIVTMKEDSTYQDLIDELKLNEVKHYDKLVFEGWKCSNLNDITDLNEKITAIRCDITASYEEDVLVLDFDYMNNDLKWVEKSETIICDESTPYYDITYREAINLFIEDIEHASGLTYKGYYSGYSDSLLDRKRESGLINVWAQAEYEEPLVYVYVIYTGANANATADGYYVIAKDGMTYQDVYNSLNLNYTHGGNKAFDNWKVTLYGQEMSSKISGISWMNITALYKDAATGGTDTSKKDDTAQTPIFIPSAPVVETIETIETVETENTAKTTTRTEVNEVVEEVAETKPAVKLETKVVEEKVQEIAQAEEGAKLVIEMKKENGEIATEVPVEILEAVKGKDVEITLDMGGYSWTINGKDVLASNLQAINLEVTLDTEAVAPSIVDALAGGEPTRQLSLTHNGDFGFKASLSINVGSEHEGEFGNLYYHDSNGKLVFMNAGQIDADGNVSLDFSHASDYVVVIGRDRTEEEALAANTDTNVQDDTSDNEGVVNDTNSGSSFPVVPIILVVAVVAVVTVVMMKKKK